MDLKYNRISGFVSTYPLRTPRTRLSMKNEPNTIRGTKYIQLN